MPTAISSCPWHREAPGELSSATSRSQKGSGKGLEHEGAAGATSPGPGSTPGLQNTGSPCHIAGVGVTSPAGYGYKG